MIFVFEDIFSLYISLNHLIERDKKLGEFLIHRSKIEGDLREVFLEDIHLVLGE